MNGNQQVREEQEYLSDSVGLLKRWGFLLLSALVMLFFSEKMYWYVQGYAIGEILILYSFGAYLVFWSIEYYKVNDFWSLFLSAMLYALLIEGIFTALIIVAGLAGPILTSYYFGWHSLLSVVFGWYFLRKWLIEESTMKLLISSILTGVFWGLWSLGYWLPEIISSPEMQEDPFDPGKWSLERYSSVVLTFGLMLVLAHWLLGKDGFWLFSFRPSKLENLVMFGLIGAMFLLQLVLWNLLATPFVIMLGLVFYALRKHKQGVEFQASDPVENGAMVGEEFQTLFGQLAGDVRFKHAFILVLIPIISIIVYGLALAIDPPEFMIRGLYWTIVSVQTIIGGILGIMAIWKNIRRGRIPSSKNP